MGRAHFFAAAAEAMRRILVESAHRRRSLKRGGGAQHIELQESQLFQAMTSDEMLAVDEAAAALGLSLRNAERIWAYSRAWLRRKVTESRN